MDDGPLQERYFIGITLPPELNRAVALLKWQFYHSHRAMQKPLQPHVTLLHPPSLTGIMPSEFLPRVHQTAKKYLPLTLSLEDIGFFGDSVAYIRVQSHSINSLQRQLVKLLPEEVRTAEYKYPYIPHVTLAQIYEPFELDKDRIIERCRLLNLPQQYTVESISYFRRILPYEYRPYPIDDHTKTSA